MIIAKVQVSGSQCTPVSVETITKGLVGATVAIEYTDSAWDNLRKAVVFRSYTTKDVLDAGDEVIVPAEVVARAGVQLYMGVYGVDADGTVVIPTAWASLGMVRGAAAPSGDSSTDPSLPVWAQIQAMIGNLDELDTTAKENLVAAVNEAFVSGGGSVSPEAVQKIVDDYLKANPPAAGKDGKDGADGITPTIGSNGNWYIGDADTGKPSRGAKGDTGSTGPKGADGVTPDIQIGTVTTLPAGSDATASFGGTAEAPLLNLGIPKGEAGQGGGAAGWEKIDDIALLADTALYELGNFGNYRKIKVMMTRNKAVSGLNKNVWVRISTPSSIAFYTCGYLSIEYGYVRWEFEAEVDALFIVSSRRCTNNINASAPVQSTGSMLLGDIAPSELTLRLEFVDTSIIQDGDMVTVLGVPR